MTTSTPERKPCSRGDWIWMLAFVAGISVGLFFLIRTVVYDFGAIDPSVRCNAAVTTHCFTRVPGVVTAADELEVVVSYDDGLRNAELGPVGNTYPDVGTRVLLERRDGHFMSAYDPKREHRYRTGRWPGMVTPGVIFGFIGVLYFLGLVVQAAACEFRLRRRQAVLVPNSR